MKRIVAIFIILILFTLSLVPAAMPVYAGSSNTNAGEMVEYLTNGIEFKGETVTRAEMVAGLIRLAFEDVPHATDASFQDVGLGDPYANEIYTALSMDVISKGDNFYPDEAVTYAQAIRMAVSLLGYGEQAMAKGGYPFGYFVYASSLSLTFSKGNDDTLTSEEAVELLADTAEADLLAFTGLGTYEKINGATILKTIRGIEKKQGIITANEHSSLYSKTGAVTNGFALDGIEFKGSLDSQLLGYMVKVYYKQTEDGMESCFVLPVNTNVVTLSAKDCTPIVNHRITDDNDKEYKIESVYNFIYNGKAYSRGDTDRYFNKDNVTLTLIDAGCDGVYETVHASDPAYLRVSRIENGIFGTAVYDNTHKNASIHLDEGVSYQIFVVDSNGIAEGNFKDIRQNSFLSYYASEDNTLYKIFVCNCYVKGIVSTMIASESIIEINDTEYIVNDAFGNLWGNISSGTEQKFLLDEQGRVVMLATDESDYMYGWIVSARLGTGFDAGIQLKIFNEQGVMDIAALADRVMIDGSRVEASTLSDSTFNLLTDDMRLIRYHKNTAEEAKIIAIDFASVPTSGDYLFMDTSTDINNNLIKNRDFETMKLEGTAIGPYNTTLKFTESRYDAGGRCKFFVVPDSASRRQDDNQYAIGLNNVISGQEYTFAAYDIDVYGQAGAVVALTGDIMAPTAVTTTASIGVVDSVVLTVDEDGEQRYAVNVAVNKKFERYLLSDALQSQATDLDPGDIIRFHSKKTGYITSLYIDYDFPTNTVNLSNSAILGYSYGNFTNGLIYSANNEFINLINEDNCNNLTANDFRLVKYSGIITYISVQGSRDATNPRISIRFEPLQEVKDFVSCGEEADRAVAFSIWSNTQQVFIYRFH